MQTSKRIFNLAAFVAVAAMLAACQDASAPAVTGPAPSMARGGGGTAGGPTAITTCGATITTPGKYVVATDLSGCTSAMTIRSSDVTLDLQGHTVSGVGAFHSIGLDVVAANNVSIRNGTFTNYFYGIEFEGVTNSRMSGMTASGNVLGFVLNADFFSNPGQTPPSANDQFYDNVFSHNSSSGLDANGAVSNKFRGNQANDNGHAGFYFFWADGNDVRGNEFLDNGYSGLDMILNNHDNIIQANRALGNGVFDFADENSTPLNTWKANTFKTASRTFIQ